MGRAGGTGWPRRGAEVPLPKQRRRHGAAHGGGARHPLLLTEQEVAIRVRPGMQHALPTADDHATCAYSGLRSLASLLHEQEEREAQQRLAGAEPAAKAGNNEGERT